MNRESRRLRLRLRPRLQLDVEMRRYEDECKHWFAPPYDNR